MNLIKKYNIPVPRYTSYPTVPFWETSPTSKEWELLVKESFRLSNDTDGISLYIHLPFCESLCTYCACNTRITINHKVEESYIDALLREWYLYLDVFRSVPKIREIHLGGGTPTFFSAANLKRLINGILTTAIICKDAEFSFEAHPGNTTKEHLFTLFNLGFKRVSFGIQDFDLKVQDAIHRFQSFEEVKAIVELARHIGYTSVNFDLIYGLPFQTLDGIVKTIDQSVSLRPDRIAFYSYAHVPWVKPGQRKFTEKDLPQDEVKRKLYEVAKELFLKNEYVEIGMDHFSLKYDSLYKAAIQKNLHRNFMGYTHNYTRLLIGIGVSSISDTWTGFAQNLKTVEEYQECVNKGKLPILKGHILNPEDLYIREHILDLMCRLETKWKDPEHIPEFISKGIERVKELEKDGLVIVEKNGIKVTEQGKSFLRNVCLCFDARFWSRAPREKIFSSAV